MADNTTLKTGTGGDVVSTDDLTSLNGGAVSGVKVFRGKLGFGSDASLRDVDASNGLPIHIVSMGAQATASGNIAAGGTGTIGPLDVTNYGVAAIVVKNQTASLAFAGSPVLVFEQSDDGTSWAPWSVQRHDTGSVDTTFILDPNLTNTSIVFNGALEAVTQIRVRVTTGPTTNPLTVVIRASVMAFSPHVSMVNKHMAGRTPWHWWIDAQGPTSETAQAGLLHTVTGGTPASTTAYSVPAGKTLRLVGAVMSMTSSNTTPATGKVRIRAVASGTATATSPIVMTFPRMGAWNTTTGSSSQVYDIRTYEFGDGYEFAAGNSFVTTMLLSQNTATMDVLLFGYLY